MVGPQNLILARFVWGLLACAALALVLFGLALVKVGLDHSASRTPGPSFRAQLTPERAQEEIRNLGGEVGIISAIDERDLQKSRSSYCRIDAPWMGNDDDFVYFPSLENLKAVHITSARVGDGALLHLRGLDSIRIMTIASPRCTNACIDSLISLPNLASLDVAGSGITAEGLRKLARERPDIQCRSSR